jgi:hypothetical protein
MRASIGLFAALLLVGCVDRGDEGMFIVANTAAPSGSCTFTGSTSQPFLAQGTLGANPDVGYLLTPLIQSRITAPTSNSDQRTIHLQGANIVVSQVDASGKLSTVMMFAALFAASLTPGGTANVDFDVLPVSLANTPGLYNVNVTVFGTLGGGRIDGEPFDYPIQVCTNFQGDGNPCNPLQDVQCLGTSP